MRTFGAVLTFLVVAAFAPASLQADLINGSFQPCFERPQFQPTLRDHPEMERGQMVPRLMETPEIARSKFDQPARSQPLFDRTEIVRPEFDSCQTHPVKLHPENRFAPGNVADKTIAKPDSLIPRDRMNFVDVDANGNVRHQVPVVSTTCCGTVPAR